jgi:hypothetical protein
MEEFPNIEYCDDRYEYLVVEVRVQVTARLMGVASCLRSCSNSYGSSSKLVAHDGIG